MSFPGVKSTLQNDHTRVKIITNAVGGIVGGVKIITNDHSVLG
jgi:hypothetical protein